MITELMIILIVVGAIIIFVAWTSARKRKREEDEIKDAEESAEKFKQDLEKTANEIIGRMEAQAARMEKLLNESERNRAQNEGRIAELKKLIRTTDLQAAELKDFLARLENAVDDVNAIRNSQPARQPLPRTPVQNPAVLPRLRTAPTSSFAEVLEESLTEKPAPTRRISELPAISHNSEQNETENSADSAAVREMLLAGVSVEEIARKTGLGRGAIMLVKQMMRRHI